MAVSLKQDQNIELDTERYDISEITIGLGWETKKNGGGLLKLFKNEDSGFDLDALALLLSRNGRLRHEDDVIYFGNLVSSDGSIAHSGDHLTGKNRGDSEQIIINLADIPDRYDKITLAVIIHDAIARNQNFGMLDTVYVRAMDKAGNEMVRFDLSNDGALGDKVSMLIGEIYRYNEGWGFRALGTPLNEERVSRIAAKYA